MSERDALTVAAVAAGVVLVFGGWLWWMRSQPPAVTPTQPPSAPTPAPPDDSEPSFVPGA
jgi:hypothetical protein